METIEIPEDLSQILILALPFNNLTFLKGTLRIHQKNDIETVFIKITLPNYKLTSTHFTRNILQYGNQTITFKKKSVKSLIKTNNHEFVKEGFKEEGRIEDIQFNSNSYFILTKNSLLKEELSKFVEFVVNFDTNLLEMKSGGTSVKVSVEGYGEGIGRFSLRFTDLKYLVGLLNVFESCKVFMGTEGVFNFVFQGDEIHVSCFIVGL